MQSNEIHNEQEHASVSLKVIVLVFAVVLVGALSYFVWEAQNTITDNGSTVVIKKDTTETVEKDVITKETITLAVVDDSTSTGTATWEYDQAKGLFSHTVEATLDDPAEDKFYEGWLVRGKVGDENFKFISTGKLVKGDDGLWTLSLASPMDHSEFNEVVITLETLENGLDNKPETHILEGIFETKK